MGIGTLQEAIITASIKTFSARRTSRLLGAPDGLFNGRRAGSAVPPARSEAANTQAAASETVAGMLVGEAFTWRPEGCGCTLQQRASAVAVVKILRMALNFSENS
jgi:hypothetical protein